MTNKTTLPDGIGNELEDYLRNTMAPVAGDFFILGCVAFIIKFIGILNLPLCLCLGIMFAPFIVECMISCLILGSLYIWTLFAYFKTISKPFM